VYPSAKEEKLRSEATTLLLLGLLQITTLLAILFRLSRMFTLIANTQRELRRAIYYQGERQGPERTSNASGRPADAWGPRPRHSTIH
jgi:hypothetical protein